jgi:hypothetical protein
VFRADNTQRKGGAGRRRPKSNQDNSTKVDDSQNGAAEMLSMDALGWENDLMADDWAHLADMNSPSEQMEAEEEKAWRDAEFRSAVEDVRESWREQGKESIFNILLSYHMEGSHGDLKSTAESIPMSYDYLKQLNRKLKGDLKDALDMWQ